MSPWSSVRISQTHRRTSRVLGVLVSVLVLVVAAYAAWRLNKHALDQLQPAYIAQNADARSFLAPSLSERINVLTHPRRDDPAKAPRLIALTFDDGPYPITTPLLLDRLHDLGVPATFFLIGDDAEQYPDLTRRIVLEHNEIGNHTWNHPDLDRIAPAAIPGELSQAARAIESMTGATSAGRIMRPPHGRFNLAAVEAIQSAGYDVVLWTDAPGDWHPTTAQQLTQHMLASATAPEIAILHSGSLPTIEMLPQVVARFRAAGYRFVTVSELVKAVGAQGINERAHISLRGG